MLNGAPLAHDALDAIALGHKERRLHPAELRARSRVIPLIEYGARGTYVVICPQEGELHLTPNSPEWLDIKSFERVKIWGHPKPRQGASRPLDPALFSHYSTGFDMTGWPRSLLSAL